MFPDQIIPKKCYQQKFPPKKGRISKNDAIIYHISIGFGQDPMNEEDLKFTYENHP